MREIGTLVCQATIDCNIDGGILAKFDADADYLDEEMDFTFEDFSMPESFANLDGFLTN